MKTLAQQFLDIHCRITIDPLAVLEAAKFIKENMIVSSKGNIGNWYWGTIMFKDSSVVGQSICFPSNLYGGALTFFR